MIISRADVIVTSPDRNFVTLRLETDEGHVGLGDATVNGRELAVVGYLRDHVVQLLVGRDASKIEDTWQFLYRSAYWRRGPVTMAAIASVDMALWDIKAKKAGMPLYQLLGGASRTGLLAYGHASGTDLPSLFDSVRDHPLKWIWTHSEALNRYRGTGWMREPCRSCAWRDEDLGGCRCQAFALAGDAAATDPACALSPQHEEIFRTAEREAATGAERFIYRNFSGGTPERA